MRLIRRAKRAVRRRPRWCIFNQSGFLPQSNNLEIWTSMKNDMHLKEMRFGIAALCRPIKWPLHLLPLLLLGKFSKGRKEGSKRGFGEGDQGDIGETNGKWVIAIIKLLQREIVDIRWGKAHLEEVIKIKSGDVPDHASFHCYTKIYKLSRFLLLFLDMHRSIVSFDWLIISEHS